MASSTSGRRSSRTSAGLRGAGSIRIPEPPRAAASAASRASANTLAAIICLGLLSAGWYSSTSLLWTIPPRFLSEAESAGGIAFISAIGGLGALITPPIFGYLIQRTGSIAAGSFYIAAVLICGSLAVLSIRLAPVEKR